MKRQTNRSSNGWTALAAGAVGAIALTALHESTRQLISDPPRMDKLGEETIEKGLHALHLPSPHGKPLYRTALIGDLLVNALFYALVGKGGGAWLRGGLLGSLAGVGAALLPSHLGLNEKYSSDTTRKSWLTFSYYLVGGLASAAMSRTMSRFAVAR